MDLYYKREIQEAIERKLFKGKVVVIYGARQVGKTTLVNTIQAKYAATSTYYNCDEPDIRAALTDKTSTELKAFLGSKDLVILDEAQRVRNIGLTLKLLVDTFPHTQIVATGSSSFDLSNEVIEPLTGRKYEFYLYPLSLRELSKKYLMRELERLLERRMIFGMYPEIVSAEGDVTDRLKALVRSYLYKDVLRVDKIKNSEAVERLLKALALQIGHEVSYNELAETVGVNKNTVMGYMRILEQAFIIFRLNPFSRNVRNELKKLRKVYFYDTGLRNALINNLNPLELRQDTGALWENFMLAERLKYNQYRQADVNAYFWRTQDKSEIDYLEEAGGTLSAYEIKWRKDTARWPKAFQGAYPHAKLAVIHRGNFGAFVGLPTA